MAVMYLRDREAEYPPAAKMAKSLRAKGRLNWVFEVADARHSTFQNPDLHRNPRSGMRQPAKFLF